MPEPRQDYSIQLLPNGESEQFYLETFMQKFDAELINVLSVFKKQGKLWEGWSGYQTERSNYFRTKRDGVLIYRRE